MGTLGCFLYHRGSLAAPQSLEVFSTAGWQVFQEIASPLFLLLISILPVTVVSFHVLAAALLLVCILCFPAAAIVLAFLQVQCGAWQLVLQSRFGEVAAVFGVLPPRPEAFVAKLLVGQAVAVAAGSVPSLPGVVVLQSAVALGAGPLLSLPGVVVLQSAVAVAAGSLPSL